MQEVEVNASAITPSDLRTAERHDCCLPAVIYFNGIRLTECVIKDISIGGMRLYIPGGIWTPGTFVLKSNLLKEPITVRKTWSNGYYAGVRFQLAR